MEEKHIAGPDLFRGTHPSHPTPNEQSIQYERTYYDIRMLYARNNNVKAVVRPLPQRARTTVTDVDGAWRAELVPSGTLPAVKVLATTTAPWTGAW
jgi:hypothetical protein